MSDSIDARRQALHDAFFQDRDQELLDFLDEQAQSEQEKGREELRIAAKVDNPVILDKLEKLGITAPAMTAFMLLPLVRLAWADTKMAEGEFHTLLKAADEEGITYGTPAYRLLSRWLDERPSERMIETWTDYARALSQELDEESLSALRTATIERAKKIATASGGFLGLGDRVSRDEQNVLHDLSLALSKTL
jgi:hypothetical protein